MVDNEKILSKIQLIQDNLQQLETIKTLGWEEFRANSSTPPPPNTCCKLQLKPRLRDTSIGP